MHIEMTIALLVLFESVSLTNAAIFSEPIVTQPTHSIY